MLVLWAGAAKGKAAGSVNRDGERMTRNHRSTLVWWNLLFIAIYVPTAVLGIGLAIPPGNVTPVYPAAGLAFGAYLWRGRAILPGIFLGAVLGNLVGILRHGADILAVSASLAIGVGEVLSVIVGAALLGRFVSAGATLESPLRVVWLFTVCLLWLVSPTVGVTALAAHGLLPWADYGYTWVTWWLGDAIGLMLVTPLVLLAWSRVSDPEHAGVVPPSLLPATLAYGALTVTLSLAPLPVTFLLLPATMLLVLRYEILGAAVASALCSVLIIGMVLAGSSLYGEFALNERLLLVQMLIAVNAFTGYFLAAHVRTIARLHTGIDLAREESERDHLTGLLNRRGFERYAGQALHQLRHDDHGLALVMLDIDDFKTINDTYGHDFGDRVLVSLGCALHRVLRTTDHAARLGGDEFMLLLQATSLDELRAISSRLLGVTGRLQVADAPPEFSFTLSGGVAFTHEANALDALVVQADKRLYQAKQAGKNRIVWPDEP